MKKTIVVLVFLMGFMLSAQHTISGTFSPAKEYSWLIAYRLKPGTQVYVADTSIDKGEFRLKLPENALPGNYRLVYAVPQEEFYFDVIYNGKEAIELTFTTAEGVRFTTSEENIFSNSYFKEINAAEKNLINYYTNGNTEVNEFQEIVNTYKNVQSSFEEKTVGLVVNEFIKANKPYIPSNYESIQDYVAHKKENYFKGLDFKNPVLQASGFLTDKFTNYVFTALPLAQMTQQESEKAMQDNVITASKQVLSVSDNYRFHLLYTLWSQASANGFNDVCDFIYNSYLKTLGGKTANQEIIDKIEIHNRLRLGAVAPEMTWKKGESLEKLSALTGAENYVLVFWSSNCGHCLKELPALNKKLKQNPKVKVIAIGLEEDEINWKKETGKLDGFEHAIALGKWESDYAKLYDIHSTPSYFILDSDKRIIAKPESDKEVVEFLEK